MIKSLRVLLWNEEIGRLAWDERRKLSYFTYNPEFVKKGLNVSPLLAPLNGVRALIPIWGEEAKIYQKQFNQSKSAIYNQLISPYGEEFTEEEANYAIQHLDY